MARVTETLGIKKGTYPSKLVLFSLLLDFAIVHQLVFDGVLNSSYNGLFQKSNFDPVNRPSRSVS